MTTFPFGRNWQRYVARHLSDERQDKAMQSLVELLEVDLRGKTFLDIGAGSGLFSLSAIRLGADRVVSVDVDPESVESCQILRDSIDRPSNWHILQGSILDTALLAQVSPAEVVYSWGVLHHTGDLYAAIRNAASLVTSGGLFCIGIYNRAEGRLLNSERWLVIKRAYNHAPRAVQVTMEWSYQAYWVLRQVARLRNPFRAAREYQTRGMAVKTDVIDWLGGYPYECATAHEIVSFCERECGMAARKVVEEPRHSLSNHEFVFERVA